MENSLPRDIKAYYDHKRFPEIWQALMGCALMQFVVLVPLEIIQLLSGGDYTDNFRTAFGKSMFNGILSQFFAVLIIPLFFLLIFKKDMRSTLRLKKNIDLIQILLLFLTSIGIFFLVQFINGLFIQSLQSFMGEPSDALELNDAENLSQLMFQLVIIAGLPSICEEIFFRGFVMRSFERYSPIGAIILSSVIFAIMHGNLLQLVYAFILGLILGTVTMLTDSLLAGTLMHFTLNTISILLSYPPVYTIYEGFVTKQPIIYFAIAIMLLPLVGIGALVLFILYTKKKNKSLYGKSFVSDLSTPELMPKQQGGKTALTVISWIVFIGVNVLYMLNAWYYDVIMGLTV